jgi:hypothetical protein
MAGEILLPFKTSMVILRFILLPFVGIKTASTYFSPKAQMMLPLIGTMKPQSSSSDPV